MLGCLVPTAVATCEIVGIPPSVTALLPAERAALGQVVERRARDFTGGRVCARTALAELGAQPGPLLPGPDRFPRWPTGFTGSITHCTGFCGAAVGPISQVRAVGVDAEPHAALPKGVLRVVAAGKNDHAELALQGTAWPHLHWDCVLFSAKEAVYKAWYAITREYLRFADVTVRFEPPDHFRAWFAVAGPLSAVQGRYAVRNGFVLTTVVVPHLAQ